MVEGNAPPNILNLKNYHITCANGINKETGGSIRQQTLLRVQQILIILGRTQVRLHVILCVAVLFLTHQSRRFSSTTFRVTA